MGWRSDIYIMVISATTVLLILVFFIISFLLLYKKRQVRHLQEMQEAKAQYEHEILKTELEIKEQTLKNISEEIHDNVGQILSLTVLYLSAIDLGNTEKAAIKIETITVMVEKAVRDLRSLSKSMDPDNVANVGLHAIIQYELDSLEKTGLFKTSLGINGREYKFSPSRERVIYRIIQESLNNLIKHAKASVIQISITYSDNILTVEIADDGKGFEPNETLLHNYEVGGAGIRNMTNRARLIGGNLEIKSVASKGTKVILTVPFETNQQYL